VLTADTHGTAVDKVKHLPVTLAVIGKDRQDEEKAQYVRRLGAAKVVAVGNGRNDILMLAEAGLGIGILQQEGASMKTIMAADLLCTNIADVFGLLLTPVRLQATLRC
jgi:soluble P-type ATPase